MSIRRTIIAGGLAATLLISATPALAQSTDTGHLEERLDLACARVPNLTARVERVLARIQAGADSPGSIAWLQVKADEAREAGRDQLAELLVNRIAVRIERIDVLEIRLDNLAEAAAACADRG